MSKSTLLWIYQRYINGLGPDRIVILSLVNIRVHSNLPVIINLLIKRSNNYSVFYVCILRFVFLSHVSLPMLGNVCLFDFRGHDISKF